MKYIPILFSTMMVQANMEDRKTMTRRLIKIKDIMEYPDRFLYVGNSSTKDVPRLAIKYDDRVYHEFGLKNNNCPSWVDTCPYGKPGDVLWVKEMHYSYGCWKKDGKTKTGKQKWTFVPFENWETKYFDNPPERIKLNSYREAGWYKRNSLFMPKDACRMFIKVKSVRPERVWDISPHDALNEGVEYINVDAEAFEGGELVADYMNYMWKDDENYEYYHFPYYANPVLSFYSLWEKINGKPSLEANPWVWVIEYEKIEKPKDFLTNLKTN